MAPRSRTSGAPSLRRALDDIVAAVTRRLAAVEKAVRELERGSGSSRSRSAAKRSTAKRATSKRTTAKRATAKRATSRRPKAAAAPEAPVDQRPAERGEEPDADLASEELAVVTEVPPFLQP
jgi:hypothetical protein